MVTESQVTELLFFQKTTAYSWKLLSLEMTVLWQLKAVLVSTSMVLPPLAPPERYFHSSSFGTNTCRMKMFRERKSPTIFFFFQRSSLALWTDLLKLDTKWCWHTRGCRIILCSHCFEQPAWKIHWLGHQWKLVENGQMISISFWHTA